MRKSFSFFLIILFSFFLMGNDGCYPKSSFEAPIKAEVESENIEVTVNSETVLVKGNFAFISINKDIWFGNKTQINDNILKMLQIFGMFEKKYGKIETMWEYGTNDAIRGIFVRFSPK